MQERAFGSGGCPDRLALPYLPSVRWSACCESECERGKHGQTSSRVRFDSIARWRGRRARSWLALRQRVDIFIRNETRPGSAHTGSPPSSSHVHPGTFTSPDPFRPSFSLCASLLCVALRCAAPNRRPGSAPRAPYTHTCRTHVLISAHTPHPHATSTSCRVRALGSLGCGSGNGRAVLSADPDSAGACAGAGGLGHGGDTHRWGCAASCIHASRNMHVGKGAAWEGARARGRRGGACAAAPSVVVVDAVPSLRDSQSRLYKRTCWARRGAVLCFCVPVRGAEAFTRVRACAGHCIGTSAWICPILVLLNAGILCATQIGRGGRGAAAEQPKRMRGATVRGSNGGLCACARSLWDTRAVGWASEPGVEARALAGAGAPVALSLYGRGRHHIVSGAGLHAGEGTDGRGQHVGWIRASTAQVLARPAAGAGAAAAPRPARMANANGINVTQIHLARSLAHGPPPSYSSSSRGSCSSYLPCTPPPPNPHPA